MAQLAAFVIRLIERFLYGAYPSLVYMPDENFLDCKSSGKEMR